MNENNYEIGISFASEYRHTVIEIVESLLLLGFSKDDIFYDEFQESVINGADADIVLENIYATKCSLVVVVISNEYINKAWTNKIEWKAIRRLLNSEEKNKVCLLNADETDISKLGGLHYLTDIAKSITNLDPYDIATFIKNKYDLLYGAVSYKYDSSLLHKKQAFYLDDVMKVIERNDENYSEMVKLIEKFLFLNDQNISLDDVAQLIINSSSLFPLSLFGKYGAGKSTFFTLLYYHFINCDSEDGLLYPILIDLNKLDLSKIEEAQEQLRQFIDCVNNHIQLNKDTHYLLMIDGINEYSDNHQELDAIINNFISLAKKSKKYFGRFTFCIGKDEIVPDEIRDDSLLKTYMLMSEVKIEIRPLSKGDNLDGQFSLEYRKILSTLNRLYGYGIPDKDIENVYKATWSYITNNIDYRTLHTILKVYSNSSFDTSFTVRLQEYYLKNLKNTDDYYAAARHAYDVFVLKRDDSNNSINSTIFASKFSTDFFVAVHFANALIKQRMIRSGSLGKGIVFTALTNRFIKDLIMNQPSTTQKLIVEKLIKAYKKENSDTIKAQYAYLIGRMQDTVAQGQAKNFLLDKWEELYHSLFSDDCVLLNKAVEDGSLVLFRTLSVSLMWINENSKQELFLKCIIYNERLNAINRGFHLSYYGDKTYINGDDPVFVDDGLIPITYTMEHLISSINKSLSSKKEPNKAIYLDIITLLTLYQYRKEQDEIVSRYKNILSDLISKLIRSSRIQSTTIKEYLTTMHELIEQKNSIRDVLSELYLVKTRKRKGWVKRNVEQPEMIADHMYACFLIGMFFLPNNIQQCFEYEISDKQEYTDYCKETILQILLLHDLAEAKYGDIAVGDKTEKDITMEKARYTYYQYLCSIPRIYGLGGRKMIMDEFHTQSTINAKIAYDIDKIEPVIQAFFYKDTNPEVHITEWKDYASKRLKTSWGREFFALILKTLELE